MRFSYAARSRRRRSAMPAVAGSVGMAPHRCPSEGRRYHQMRAACAFPGVVRMPIAVLEASRFVPARAMSPCVRAALDSAARGRWWWWVAAVRHTVCSAGGAPVLWFVSGILPTGSPRPLRHPTFLRPPFNVIHIASLPSLSPPAPGLPPAQVKCRLRRTQCRCAQGG